MVRTARTIASGIPHHVTQRGNNRQNVFFLCILAPMRCLTAMQYIERNPVRAKIIQNA